MSRQRRGMGVELLRGIILATHLLLHSLPASFNDLHSVVAYPGNNSFYPQTSVAVAFLLFKSGQVMVCCPQETIESSEENQQRDNDIKFLDLRN